MPKDRLYVKVGQEVWDTLGKSSRERLLQEERQAISVTSAPNGPPCLLLRVHVGTGLQNGGVVRPEEDRGRRETPIPIL